jgi:hypothetical protein
VRAAIELRNALNRQQRKQVLSLADATKQDVRPAAILTVAIDASHRLNVVYWDLWGGSDALTAPSPAAPDQFNAIALALASALLDKHRAELTAHALDPDSAARVADAGRSSRAFYALLDRVGRLAPRTNVELHLEDF